MNTNSLTAHHTFPFVTTCLLFFVFFPFCSILINEALLQSAIIPLTTMPLFNILGITIPALFISCVAGKAFTLNQSLSVLLFGCSFLISGLATLMANLLIDWATFNTLVTIHNCGVFLSGTALITSSWLQLRPCTYFIRHSLPVLLIFYWGSLLIIVLLAGAALANLTPVFWIANDGPTEIRQAILEVSVILHFQSSLLLFLKYVKSKSSFMLWYSASLLLIACGLFFVSIQQSVGDPFNLIGRCLQYTGYLYAMVAVWSAAKETRETESPREALAKFFLNAEVNYQDLVETAGFAVVSTDGTGQILIWNSFAEQLFGISKQHAIGKKLRDTLPGLDSSLSQAPTVSSRMNQEFTTEIALGEQSIPVELFSSLRKTEYGWTCTYIFKDLTEKKRYEAELARLSSLDLVGQMAAAIAHEVRNPMTTVRGFLQYYSKNLDAEKKGKYYLMIQELDRANAIISEYLSLARNKTTTFKCHSLSVTVNHLHPLMQAYALEQNKVIVLDVQDTPFILMDEKQIKQLISNLVNNALDALPPQGVVKILVFVEADSIILSVQDNGPGIPEEILSKLGTPFLTTKSNGTGLGLSVCYRIVQRHQAVMEVQTSPYGSSFNIRFPLNEKIYSPCMQKASTLSLQ